ncbi:MAG: hypothetical protein GY772_19405 [bacterium]|nr:hypothetical protein [bacterium]
MVQLTLTAHRYSNVEVRAPGRVWQDFNNAKDNLCSRMHMVKLTLKFELDFPKALEHAEPALEALAKSAGSVGRRFGSRPGGR